MREARAAKGTFCVYFPSWEAMLLALREQIRLCLAARGNKWRYVAGLE
jgi:hypothetical protein